MGTHSRYLPVIGFLAITFMAYFVSAPQANNTRLEGLTKFAYAKSEGTTSGTVVLSAVSPKTTSPLYLTEPYCFRGNNKSVPITVAGLRAIVVLEDDGYIFIRPDKKQYPEATQVASGDLSKTWAKVGSICQLGTFGGKDYIIYTKDGWSVQFPLVYTTKGEKCFQIGLP